MRRPVILGLPKVEDLLTGLLHITGVWVTSGTLSVTKQDCMMSIEVEHPASGGPPNLSGILPK